MSSLRPGTVPPDLELLTAAEVCAWLRISSPTLHRLVRAGRIRSVHVGAALRVYRASVADYLEGQALTYVPKGSRATFGARRRDGFA